MAFRDDPEEPTREARAEPSAARPDALRLRLEALAARGATRFDPAEVRFVSGLLARATRLHACAAEAARARIACRLDALDAALQAGRTDAYDALDAAIRAGACADDLRGEIAGGDPRAIALAAHGRIVATRLGPSRGLGHARRDRIASRPGEERAMPTPTERLAKLDALASGLRLDVALARASSAARFEGPYNPGAIAARLLRLLPSVAPGYLRVLARDLDDLASVAALGAETDVAPPKRKR